MRSHSAMAVCAALSLNACSSEVEEKPTDRSGAQHKAPDSTIYSVPEYDTNRRELVMASDLLRHTMPRSDFDASFRRQFSMQVYRQAGATARTRMEARMRNLVHTPWAGITTTNFDELIEFSLARWCENSCSQCSGDHGRLGSILCGARPEEMFFVKIHGSVSGGNIVLGTDEYTRSYLAASRISTFLTALMLRYHLVFVGCSLEDEVVRLRRKLTHDYSGEVPTAYALMQDNADNRRRESWLRSQAQIFSLLYDESGEDGHVGVDEFLYQAASLADDPMADRDPMGLTVEDIRRRPVVARIELIGSVNRDLLRLAWEQEGHAIGHLVLLDPVAPDTPTPESTLYRMSPEERVYRALFLVSIGILQEEQDREGLSRYVVDEAAGAAVEALT